MNKFLPAFLAIITLANTESMSVDLRFNLRESDDRGYTNTSAYRYSDTSTYKQFVRNGKRAETAHKTAKFQQSRTFIARDITSKEIDAIVATHSEAQIYQKQQANIAQLWKKSKPASHHIKGSSLLKLVGKKEISSSFGFFASHRVNKKLLSVVKTAEFLPLSITINNVSALSITSSAATTNSETGSENENIRNNALTSTPTTYYFTKK
ncbi:MAG: hypothetical protein V4482_02970 [Pseudomonadota bacterium]